MRKTIISLMMLTAACIMHAQDDKQMFNHIAIGLSTGTDGLIGFQAAMPVGHYVQVRAGMHFMPKFKYTDDYDIVEIADAYGYEFDQRLTPKTDRIEVEGKLHKSDFSLLFDVYPSRRSTFRFTAGAYIGGSKVATLRNTTPISLSAEELERLAIEIGDYVVPASIDGYIDASIKVNSFKPYIGLGFGRAVPKKRVSVMFDMGVQFWGKPGVYAKDFETGSDVKLQKLDLEDVDDDFSRILSKIVAYPVISLKIVGKLL